MFTDWEDGPAPTQMTTEHSYPAIPTEYNPPTRTVTLNMTQQSIIAEYSQYCPLTSEDYADGYIYADLPEMCDNLFDKYCEPDPDKPKPTLTQFPSSCFPWRTSATPTDTTITETSSTHQTTSRTSPTKTASSKPSPTMDGTTPKCTEHHKVVSGDTCQPLADKYGIALDNVWHA
ncbi:LysM domain-containing protein [Aspergillus sp. HF37]|nr:LysM domain-containing protein [Aspergillus sp. HF37]